MSKKEPSATDVCTSTIDGLKKVYKSKILPVETGYSFDQMFSPPLRDSDLEAKPMVLLMGSYSTGKTSFIEYLLGRPFPGQRIGPEPSTDRFVAVMGGPDERVLPGNAVAMAADKPFHALNRFGTSFLSKFEAAISPAPILEDVTLVDTPGVLSGEKQRIDRSYDYVAVCEWFVQRADLVLLLFDSFSLDVSDELKRAIEILKGHDDKVRVVLNKADCVTPQQLMRVYGALAWSLGRVFKSPEVVRIYVGSFWDKPYQHSEQAALFDAEREDLLSDLRGLPRNAVVRKINELVKRARLAKVNAFIISHLRKEMPSMFGKEKKKAELLDGILEQFKIVQRAHRLPAGDFPNLEKYRENLRDMDFSRFNKLNPKLIEAMDEALARDIPKLMHKVNPPKKQAAPEDLNPFADPNEGAWAIIGSEKERFDETFYKLGPTNGKLGGNACKSIMSESGLSTEYLRLIWSLADNDKDGALDDEEFAVALYLIEHAKEGQAPPPSLPENLIPPSQRR